MTTDFKFRQFFINPLTGKHLTLRMSTAKILEGAQPLGEAVESGTPTHYYDLNGDGVSDLKVKQHQFGDEYVLTGPNRTVTAVDFGGDGNIDGLSAKYHEHEVFVRDANGDGRADSQVDLTPHPEWEQSALKVTHLDTDFDGAPDSVTTDWTPWIF